MIAGDNRRGELPPLLRLFLIGLVASLLPAPVVGQYVIEAPSGEALSLDTASVRDMLERSRRLARILEEDPAVVYYVGTGSPVSADEPEAAHPWRAVNVRSDSAVRVATPGNYREASRAYYNYAVVRMEWIRSGRPAASCSTVVEREVERVSAFVDGWIVTRALYGGPAFAPLDLLAFAREAGHLPALVVDLGDTTVSDRCLARWRARHPDALDAYRRWRRESFEAADPTAGVEGTDGGERSLQAVR